MSLVVATVGGALGEHGLKADRRPYSGRRRIFFIADLARQASAPAPDSGNGHWSRRYLNKQFDKTNTQQRRLTGKKTCCFPPPGGYSSPQMLAEARKNDMSVVMWSVDTKDWKQSSRTTKASTAMIERNAAAGYSQKHPIVLMHTGKASHEPESKVHANRNNDVAALPSRAVRCLLSPGPASRSSPPRSAARPESWTGARPAGTSAPLGPGSTSLMAGRSAPTPRARPA